MDDEIAALENELSKQDNPKHIPTLFPGLLTNSKREQDNLKNLVEKKVKTPKESIDPESVIPDSDSRESMRTAEESIEFPSELKDAFNILNEHCGVCGTCDLCKIHTYNTYKWEIRGPHALEFYESRIGMFEKIIIQSRERIRAARDSWEERLKEVSEEEREARRVTDAQYIPLTPEVKQKKTRAAQKIADGKKPVRRVSRDEKLQGKLKDMGIDFTALLTGMAARARDFNNGKK